MSGFVLHPEAFTDLGSICDYIAKDNPTLPIISGKKFTASSKAWCSFPTKAIGVPI